MIILIAGGKLQAIEAVYLAKELGWKSVVLDRNARAPAAAMCDQFVQGEISDRRRVLPVVEAADMVLPALEEADTLALLEGYCEETGTIFLFDQAAYRLSSSKLASDRFFKEHRIPAPLYYPDASLPVIIKPDDKSGSAGVQYVDTIETLMKRDKRGLVIQEYLEGPSYSVEVIGNGQSFEVLQITEIIVDKNYDCKAVIAPAAISQEDTQELQAIAARLGALINIQGIFDIEVIKTAQGMKVLEIDARLPSQTPVSVWYSTGINMLQRIYAYKIGNPDPICPRALWVCIYKQIQVKENKIVSLGEHILADKGPLRIIPNLFGATGMITNYHEDAKEWVAAVIVRGRTQAQAECLFQKVIARIQQTGGFEYREG